VLPFARLQMGDLLSKAAVGNPTLRIGLLPSANQEVSKSLAAWAGGATSWRGSHMSKSYQYRNHRQFQNDLPITT